MYTKPVALRGVALFIDVLIMVLIGYILNSLFGFGTFQTTQFGAYFSMSWTEETILGCFYFGLQEVFWNGKTVGKALMGLEVKDKQGHDLPKSKLLIRAVAKSALLVISVLSWIAMLINNDKQAFHDMFVSSIVVKKQKNGVSFEDPQRFNPDEQPTNQE